MFTGSISIWHWLIVLIVVLLIFGTKKISNIGADLGKAVKGFKDGLKGEEAKPAADPTAATQDKGVVDVEVKEKPKS